MLYIECSGTFVLATYTIVYPIIFSPWHIKCIDIQYNDAVSFAHKIAAICTVHCVYREHM